MATRAEVSGLLAEGHTYETAGKALGIPAGQAFMIATGLPADGTPPTPAEAAEKPVLPGSSQHLVNPPAFNPKRKQEVLDWVKTRAKRELKGGA